MSRNFKFDYNLTIVTGSLQEDRYTFIVSRYDEKCLESKTVEQ